MPPTDDTFFDPERRDRIRARALARGAKLRRRRTLARRSVTASAVVVLAGGGLLLARTAGTAIKPPHHHVVGGASSTTSTPGEPTTTFGFGGTTTTTPGRSTTTVPGGPSTTVPGGTSTTVTSTTTTVPVTTTTVPSSAFHKTLRVVAAPGSLSTATWTLSSTQVFELHQFTVSATGAGMNGAIRFQLLTQGSSPQTLLETGFRQVGQPFTVDLVSDAFFLPGQALALTVTCAANQPACSAQVALSGRMFTPPRPASPLYFGNLEDVVAPGQSSTASWTVTSGHTFSLTDLVFSMITQGLKGEVQVQAVPPGSPPAPIAQMTLTELGRRPVDHQYGNPIVLGPGTQLQLNVTCSRNQGACDVVLLFSGSLRAK